jgi:hypothetical protein
MQYVCWHNGINFTKINLSHKCFYRGADKSLARPGRNQANVSGRMARISFGFLPCRKRTWWQLASRCCWDRARPWHASELVSFLVGAKDLSAHLYFIRWREVPHRGAVQTLSFSGMLCGTGWQFCLQTFRDICMIHFKCQAILEELALSACFLQTGTDV